MSTLEERHGKLAQLHPEDLLDKAEEGTLTSEERTRLDAHIEQCSACRMEQLLRGDFDADAGGDRISFSSLVEGALGVVASDAEKARTIAAEATAKPAAEVAPAPTKEPAATEVAPEEEPAVTEVAREKVVAIGRRREGAPWKRFALLFAAAFVLLATAAFASEQGRSLARKATSMFTSEEHARDKETTVQKPVAAPTEKPLDIAHAPVVPVAEAPAAVVDPPPAAPEVHAPPQVSGAPVALGGSRGAPVPVAIAPVVPVVPLVEAPVVAPSPEPQDAASLFSSANDKRRAGNVAGALAAYGELVTRFPASREAATAHALRGRMLLEQHEARRALSEFDAYLAAGRGELREEAMIGRARAFGMLGQIDGERTAWQSFLAAYPSSASAEHARLRLDALAAR